ncbi:MAG: ABC transporter permease, partial [Gammaproteobacteria bacterium]|nr:ABC transporter permease [Gammaproteobacteria bacterium]NIR99114.1 ABC transporter permease [Gammaproteobacteria bacterium]NIT64748.1 ABC transporter permease [Gammaproteobacteria bacterium]NIV21709.1 ABC transporter permease [Gammaproteobacteria bacterium]NIV75335.1 ABC transporter permease [Gammaproteobacteria bacterium]
MAPLIRRSSWRYLWRHPWQVALAVLGVGLGVAVAVAVDVASGSAHRAFELSMDEVAGRATHQIVGGPAGVDEQVYARLRLQAGVRPSAPAV